MHSQSGFRATFWCLLAASAIGSCTTMTPANTDANVSTDGSVMTDGGTCNPDPARWTEMGPMVQRYCGTCHGSPTAFGAPVTLTDRDMILSSRGSTRLIDAMAARVAAGTMPPTGYPQPGPEERRAFVEWASCGAMMPTATLSVSAPHLTSPPTPPEGTRPVELKADFQVPRDARDLYQCFSFDAPVTQEQFIRRIDMVLGDVRVIHHLTFLRDREGTAPRDSWRCNPVLPYDYLYAWAPGQDSVQFPDGGLRVRPGERFVMQLHYNNGGGFADARDRSGVRLHLAAPQGTEYGMVAIGPTAIAVPPRGRGTAMGHCSFDRPTRIFASAPHMHLAGSAFRQEAVRVDGTRARVINLSGWKFDTQLFYSTPFELAAGDRLETRCDFVNPTDQLISGGEGTTDEMCFNFAYVTPPPPTPYCDQLPPATQIPYTVGRCAPAMPNMNPPLADGRFRIGTPPALSGTQLPEGRWELAGGEFWLSSANTQGGLVVADASRILLRGQATIASDGQIRRDTTMRIEARLSSGLTFDNNQNYSVAGSVQVQSPGNARLTVSCFNDEPMPSGGADVHVGMDGDRLVLGWPGRLDARTTFELREVYRRVP